MTVSVTHQPDKQRFVSVLEGQESVLEYRLLPDHVIDFTRTFVPEPLRGQGIAEKLVRTGIGWARGQTFEMTASCWYVSRFLKRGK
ncbi:MAG: GNAT family N-acetyltransferase [Pseudomonadota bacterium]